MVSPCIHLFVPKCIRRPIFALFIVLFIRENDRLTGGQFPLPLKSTDTCSAERDLFRCFKLVVHLVVVTSFGTTLVLIISIGDVISKVPTGGSPAVVKTESCMKNFKKDSCVFLGGSHKTSC